MSSASFKQGFAVVSMLASTLAPSRTAAVGSGGSAVYPDVVLLSQDRGRKVMAVIEVETVESVNNLEALAEWVPYGRLKSAFHLYVPAQMIEVAKRLCTDSHIPVAEIHTYHWIGDEMRFMPVYKAPRRPLERCDREVCRSACFPKTIAPRPPAKAVATSASAKASAGPASAKAATQDTSKAAAKKIAAKPRKKIGRSTKRK